MNEPLNMLLQRAAHFQREGRRVIGCLLVRARGSTPQSEGALMLVDEALQTFGTIGGGCVEAEVRREAHQFLMTGRTGLLNYKLNHDYGWDDGLICGGRIDLAVGPLPAADELDRIAAALDARQHTRLPFVVEHTDEGWQRYVLDLPPRPRLFIAGAGHVGQAVARLALGLDFDVTLFDDRPDLLQRFAPDGAQTSDGDIADSLRREKIDLQSYCVIVTRGHRHDEQALHAVIDRGAAYVGMIGSRRKIKLIFDDLEALGVNPQAMDSVHAPIGLPINAVTVEEIAVSIVAELVQVRRAAQQKVVAGPEPCGAPELRHAPITRSA